MDTVDKNSMDTIIALAKGLANLNDRYLDLESLSLYSGIGKSCLRQHIERDGLPAYFPRGKVLVRKSDFDTWLHKYKYQKQSKKKRNQKELKEVVDGVVNEVRGKGSAV